MLLAPLPGSVFPPHDQERTLLNSFLSSVLPSFLLHQFSWHLVGQWLKDLHRMWEFCVWPLLWCSPRQYLSCLEASEGRQNNLPTHLSHCIWCHDGKEQISEVLAQVRCSWWAKWIVYESMEAWMCGAAFLGSSMGDEREWASVFSSLWRDL